MSAQCHEGMSISLPFISHPRQQSVEVTHSPKPPACQNQENVEQPSLTLPNMDHAHPVKGKLSLPVLWLKAKLCHDLVKVCLPGDIS